MDHDYSLENEDSPRLNATLLSLVRNEDLSEILPSMHDLERTWNRKFNYPWAFFNDVSFTEEFKRRTQAATNAKCHYHTIPQDDWSVPSWINMDLYAESAKRLHENNVQHGNELSYHQMCRWNSGLFYHHPGLKNMQYYWRVEPKVRFFCDVDYDVFHYM
jgi:mannosyltransferase